MVLISCYLPLGNKTLSKKKKKCLGQRCCYTNKAFEIISKTLFFKKKPMQRHFPTWSGGQMSNSTWNPATLLIIENDEKCQSQSPR